MREEKRKEFRKRLEGIIPPELDTDFQVDRWLECYDDVIFYRNRRFATKKIL
jgi:hypothetical protein